MSCPNLKPYQDVRNDKLSSINKYLTELLDNYDNYPGTDPDNTKMRQQYKAQLDKLNNEMIKILNEDTALLLEQNDELNQKTKQVNDNTDFIKQLKEKIELEKTSNAAREKSEKDMYNIYEKQNKYHNVKYYLNILVFLIFLSLLAVVLYK